MGKREEPVDSLHSLDPLLLAPQSLSPQPLHTRGNVLLPKYRYKKCGATPDMYYLLYANASLVVEIYVAKSQSAFFGFFHSK